mmetsp:Transcript_24835/g.37005  ORF Transcript_24835/g.37005 Transcript_24835/m.37005 type:complete len:632 (-) Transcript_24835:312-2207(-)
MKVITVVTAACLAFASCSEAFTPNSAPSSHVASVNRATLLNLRNGGERASTSLSNSADSDATSSPPPSRIESLVANAKSLLPFGERKTSEEGDSVTIQSLAAGLAVSLAMIPEAVAFSFVAGVNPLVGLWTTVILGFVAASFGGRAGICSSASGAVSVVIAALCASHGPVYLSGCAILAGLIQIAAGFLRLGKFIRLVPHPVMLGFVNGLAVVMTNSQLIHFKDASTGAFFSLFQKEGAAMYGVTALTMALVKLLPKISFLKSVPPSLGAVALATTVSRIFSLPVKTLADIAGAETFRGGLAVLPKIALPSLPYLTQPVETLRIILPFAITMAAVGSIESLLTMQLLDGIADDGKRGSTRKECIGQGLGNVASGLTGGIGGCALLGQSIINVQSGGGKSRLSGMSMAVFLALGIVSAAPLLGTVPIATLVGVMLLVCQSTFSWSSLRLIGRIPKLDLFVIALVSAITVYEDLAKAVVAGIITSALGFAWQQSTSIIARESSIPAPVKGGDKTWKSYNLSGPLFFGSTSQFSRIFNVKSDPSNVVIDFTNSRVLDHSALEAINNVAERYGEAGKTVHLRHLSSDCAQLLGRLFGDAKPYKVVESDPDRDPVYGVAEESEVYGDIPLPNVGKN